MTTRMKSRVSYLHQGPAPAEAQGRSVRNLGHHVDRLGALEQTKRPGRRARLVAGPDTRGRKAAQAAAGALGDVALMRCQMADPVRPQTPAQPVCKFEQGRLAGPVPAVNKRGLGVLQPLRLKASQENRVDAGRKIDPCRRLPE